MKPQRELAELTNQTKQAGVETAGSVLKGKGHQIWSIGPHATVYTAIALMATQEIGALMVMSELDLLGILTERDYARKVILRGRSSRETPVSDIMTTPVITVTPEHTIDQCLRIMTARRIRYLPVVEESVLEGSVLEGSMVSGVLSIGDLVRSVLSMQAHTIDQLETYIANSYPK